MGMPSPEGRGWTATALSAAVAGRVRGYFLWNVNSAPGTSVRGPSGVNLARRLPANWIPAFAGMTGVWKR